MNLRVKIAINYLGQAWSAIIGLIFIPIYVELLGIDAYGVIGIFTVLMGFMTIADFGLTPTVNREIAKYRAGRYSLEEIKDLLFTMQGICLGIGMLVILIVFFISPYIAKSWIITQDQNTNSLIIVFKIMGLSLALRWIEQFYRSALIGYQDTIWLNIIWSIINLARWGGAALILIIFNPTLILFFSFQVLVSLISIILLSTRVGGVLNDKKYQGKFKWKTLYVIKDFSLAMFIGSILAFVLSNLDRIVISKVLPIKELGYYTLAATISSALLQIVGPMSNSVYPKFIEYKSKNNLDELVKSYLKSSRILSTLLIPFALLIIFQSREILYFWTGNIEIVENVSPILILLAIGTLCNGFITLPYMLQLAYDWTSLSIWCNSVTVVILIPALIFLTEKYGLIGAASCWLAINITYVIVITFLMHNKILKDIRDIWLKTVIICPLIVGSIPFIMFKLIILFINLNKISTALSISLALFSSMYIIYKYNTNKYYYEKLF